MDAILYTSNTGSTERYARLLGEKTGLAVYPLEGAPLPAGAEVLYMGWVMASTVRGYKKAAKKYAVKALCGVCMAATGTQIEELRKANGVDSDMPVFTLQGGFDIRKLHGVYRFMMSVMTKTVGKSLAEKPNRTPDEDDMLDMLLHGGDRVDEANLAPVLDWYRAQN